MALAGFHPAVRRWFADRLGEPTAPQREGWPAIRSGAHTLIAAPTGTGKTLAAFLHGLDELLRKGDGLGDATEVLYVSPLKALANDVQKNLLGPLEEIRALDPSLPEVRVLVRSGDTKPSQRTAMGKKPPHILVTTPESLYILLTSDGGRNMLKSVRTVVVDEIHAVLGNKRGSHLALSLERLDALCGGVQRVGLSATQKPIEAVGQFLVGQKRACTLVDTGHKRELDLAVEVPPSPLETVCSTEVWEEIYRRIGELIGAHKTTLVFVNTRKLAERVAARLRETIGEEKVACHHGSLSKERRLDAEDRLKSGSLRALVATASLELGIDIGEVDLVIQIGTTASIATFLQRVGRSGHALGRTPKGRLFPLTPDELCCAAALLRAVQRGELDKTPVPGAPLDILAQQVIAACAAETWDEQELFARFKNAWPYRELKRDDFDAVVALHTKGRHALLHRDGVNGRLRGTRRARLTAITCGGAIPDTGDYRVVLEPEEALVGMINEDFAIESSVGDVFQLGTHSWQILKIETGTVRVRDAGRVPPTLPFWFGEAPARTSELSAGIAELRETWADGAVDPPEGLPEEAIRQIVDYLAEGKRVLGTVPSQSRLVLERFFDESGGMQVVLHSPYGGRINRALGLALRKRFCRGFGFELQAAANEEAIVFSLGPQHSFPLGEVFDYLHPTTARDVLTQALLPAPMFKVRWRWNVARSLMTERFRAGRRVPLALLRMRAEDLLAQAFPEVVACPENLPGGDLPVPLEHPIVSQTVHDCLTEAMDVDGFLDVLGKLRDGGIERVAIDVAEPSAFARGVLNAMPYAFLDDAPLEERRTQAVAQRRTLDKKTADELGALDPAAVARVKEEAWPDPRDVEEVHEALLWMGHVADDEACDWKEWLEELAAAGRVVRDGGRWFAAEASRDPLEILRGRMEALGPVFSDDPLLVKLETEGSILRVRLDGREAWCERRLLARIHRYTLDALRREIEPVTASDFLRFLCCWQHVDEEHRLDGPAGVAEVVRQLAGFEVPAAAWEKTVLPMRVRGYRPDWLDRLTLSGEVAWGRLWGGGASAIRATPLCLVPREELDAWEALAGPPDEDSCGAEARAIKKTLEERGAIFLQELKKATGLLPSQLERGLGELVSFGLATCDSFSGLRALVVPPSRRRYRVSASGRWTLFRKSDARSPSPEFVARRLLCRTGVVFRRTVLREKLPVYWRDLLRVFRQMELRGDIRGGRFVSGFSGEQFALPEAIKLLRKVRKQKKEPAVVAAADPLNFRGILTPDERVPPGARREVVVG